MQDTLTYGMAALVLLVGGYLGYSVASCATKPHIKMSAPPPMPCVSSLLTAPNNYAPPEILNQVLGLEEGSTIPFACTKANGAHHIGVITKGTLDEWTLRLGRASPQYFKAWAQFSTVLNDLILGCRVITFDIGGKPFRYVGVQLRKIDEASEFDGQMFAPKHPEGYHS